MGSPLQIIGAEFSEFRRRWPLAVGVGVQSMLATDGDNKSWRIRNQCGQESRKMRMAQVLLTGLIAILSSGCMGRPQQIEERAGRWFVVGLPEGSSKYSFAPLDSSWEPNPPPTDNCALFYRKKGEGTHIGVFLHPLKPGVEPERILNDLPKELMSSYLSSSDSDNRRVLVPPTPYGNGVFGAAENRFTMAGAKVRAFEAFVIVPCTRYLVGFTFKRRIAVDSLDFRREQGQAVVENEMKAQPEYEEFLAFVRGASFWDGERTIKY